MPLTKEKTKKAKEVIVIIGRGTKSKKIRIPERVEDVSLRWLRNAPFFSEFLLRFNYYISEDVPTMGVNSTKGRINLYINEEFMNGGGERVKIGDDGRPVIKKKKNGEPKLDKDGDIQLVTEPWKGLKDEELEGVLIHEIMHLVRMHHERRNENEPYIWNISGDMLINDDIKDMSIGNRKIKLPGGAIYLDMAKEDGYKGEPITEPLYDWLIDMQQEYMNQMTDLMQAGQGQGQGKCKSCGGSGESKEDCKTCGGSGKDKDGKNCPDCGGSGKEKCSTCNGTGKGSGRNIFDIKYGSNIDDHDIIDQSDQLAESTIKEVIDVAKVRGWGNISGDAVSKLEELCRPSRINWKQYLRKALSSYVFSHGNIYENSWARRNRRQLPLPGIRKLSNRAVIGVDTSGSISQKELEQFFTEIENIIKDCALLTIVQWDTEVKSVWQQYKRGDWRKIEISGRGGTDVQNTFDWMIENKRKSDMLIMFTDGYFSFDYDTHGIKTLWCVTNEEQSPPSGQIVYVEVDD